MVHLVEMVVQVPKVPADHKVLVVKMVVKAHLVGKDRADPLVHVARKDPVDNRVAQDLRAHVAPLEEMVAKAHLVKMVVQVPKDRKVHVDHPERMGAKVHLVVPDLLVLKDPKVILVVKDHVVLKVVLDHRAFLVIRVPKVAKDARVQPDHAVAKDPMVPRDSKVVKVPVVLWGLEDHLGEMAAKDPKGQRVK